MFLIPNQWSWPYTYHGLSWPKCSQVSSLYGLSFEHVYNSMPLGLISRWKRLHVTLICPLLAEGQRATDLRRCQLRYSSTLGPQKIHRSWVYSRDQAFSALRSLRTKKNVFYLFSWSSSMLFPSEGSYAWLYRQFQRCLSLISHKECNDHQRRQLYTWRSSNYWCWVVV